MILSLLQSAAAATSATHPLTGGLAEWVWLLPLLPLLGFVINGLLSLNSARFGPADPNTPGHHPHSEGAAEAPAISHTEQAGAVGDDHHAVKRHRWAAVVSIVGPGVLILSFALAVGMFLEMTGANLDSPFVQTYFSWMAAGD